MRLSWSFSEPPAMSALYFDFFIDLLQCVFFASHAGIS